jgi:D-beta-D-heptose 7-phosphate kinase/D-beta-D-heptose 1-phosphate adenosyltransferase
MKKKAGSSRPLLREAVKRFAGMRILVIGDVMVDRYFSGNVRRISPEAPVPVVEVTGETMKLGGAANVAHNILTLGGRALLCGVAGLDRDGEWLVDKLESLGIDRGGLFLAADLPTTVKSRVVAHSQQVVRFDRERKGPLPDAVAIQMADYLRGAWAKVDGVIVSDYGKGVIDERLMDCLRLLNRGRGRRPVAVDPKSSFFQVYRGMSVITPNLKEAVAAAALPGEGMGLLERVGANLLRRTRAGAVLITRGEDGMSLFEKGADAFHIPTVAREVYDVTGAGDTVIAALALALSAGSPLREAAYLANVAAGVVVGEFGTVPVTKKQLLAAIPRSAAL